MEMCLRAWISEKEQLKSCKEGQATSSLAVSESWDRAAACCELGQLVAGVFRFFGAHKGEKGAEMREGHCSAASGAGLCGALSKVKLGGVLDGVLHLGGIFHRKLLGGSTWH